MGYGIVTYLTPGEGHTYVPKLRDGFCNFRYKHAKKS